MTFVGLQNLEQLRTIQWGAKWLWDIQFPEGPAEFQEWFPATDVTENLWTLETHPITAGYGTYEVPLGTTLFNISVTFVDDVYQSINEWLDNWVNVEILGSGKYIASLEKAVKQVNIAKLTGMKKQVSLHSYWVFPKGAYNWEGSSASDPDTGTVELIVAGTISKENFTL